MELFGFEVSIPIILLVAVVVLLYLYGTWTFSTFKNMGIPGPAPRPFFGNLLQMKQGYFKKDIEWINKYGKIFGVYEGPTPILIFGDPELVKQVCVKHFTSFYNRRPFLFANKPLDTGVHALRGEKWKRTRNILTPAFTASKMRMMTPIVNSNADPMMRILRKHSEESEPVLCNDLFGSFVSDVVASTGFGVEINTQENPDHPFTKNAEQVNTGTPFMPLVLMTLLFPRSASLLNWLNISHIPRKPIQYFIDLAEDTIALRKNQDASNKRVDFLQLMLDAHDVYEEYIKGNEAEEDENGVKLVKDGKPHTGDLHKGFTKEEILGQALTFYTATYHTTSTLLSFVSYAMATTPEVQDKLCAEIDDVMANYDEPTYEAISKMPYLEMVICETLRMYPPSTRFTRVCNEDVTIAGVHIPKGMMVSFPIYAIHHNPAIYPEPEKLIPERFTKEEKEKRHPYAWIPFGAGPRNCIGMRFALLETKISLVRIFQKFTFEPCAETEIPMKLGTSIMLSPPNGIKVGVKERR